MDHRYNKLFAGHDKRASRLKWRTLVRFASNFRFTPLFFIMLANAKEP